MGCNRLKYVRCRAVVLLAASVVVGVAAPLPAQVGGNYDLTWNSIQGGGGRSSGGAYVLRGTIGQAAAGQAAGGAYGLTGGFWAVPPPKPGDITSDGKVNIFDLQRLAACWNTQQGQPNYNPGADFNEDGKINIFDLQVMAQFWNT